MPRLKDYDYKHILPATFDYSLCYPVDYEIDQAIFYVIQSNITNSDSAKMQTSQDYNGVAVNPIHQVVVQE